MKKMKGLKNTNWWIQNSHRDVKYSIRKVVNNIVFLFLILILFSLLQVSQFFLYFFLFLIILFYFS